MTNKHIGWGLGLAAVGMMLGLMSNEVRELHTWNQVTETVFIAKLMGHASTVIMAFVGGKLIPTDGNERKGDQKPDDK